MNPNSAVERSQDASVDSKTLEEAGMIGVFDQDGNERPFGGLIRHGQVCVVFIRHFLCSYCQNYLLALKRKLDQDILAPKKFFVVGCGHWSLIKAYKELLDFPFPIYAESTRKLYDSLGMICKFDVGNPKNDGSYVPQHQANSLLAGFANGWKMGTSSFLQGGKITQLGGEFIFNDGKCMLARRMKNAKDHMEPEELVRQLMEL